MPVVALALFPEYEEEDRPMRHYSKRYPCSEEGAVGCGTCPACKRNAAKAKAKPACEKPYLGPIPFHVQFPEPKWMRQAHGRPAGAGQYAPPEYTGLGHVFPPQWSEKT